MHQTFYIDIDEEITSIVDRLRKSMAQEVVIVVPKRSILIQSIVNLKLLKKEADNLDKKLILVTQDKLGKMLIEKTGIIVEQKIDDVEGNEISEQESDGGASVIPSKSIVGENDIKNKKRFDEIGSDDYYRVEDSNDILTSVYVEKEESEEERITNKELVVDMGDDLKKQKSSFGRGSARKGFPMPMDMIRNVEIADEIDFQNKEDMVLPKRTAGKASKKIFKQEKIHEFHEKDDVQVARRDKASKFLEHRKKDSLNEYKSVNVESNAWKYFIAFGIFFILVISGMAAYLYLPKVSIVVFPKNKIESIDSQIEAKTSLSDVDQGSGSIPAKVISATHEVTREYDVTGTKNDSNQKAHGTITIYNEFSSSPQPLVATTRFETPDGKIFRLISGVTVPGVEKVGTENKPGAIEAKVIADKSGDEYNIGETNFTIPGFKSSGNEKYAKIYAKSSKAMTGGGQDSQEIKILSEADIDSAKKKVVQELDLLIRQKLKEMVGEEYVLLDEAVNMDDSTYTLSNSSGDATEKFSITVKESAVAIVFRNKDIKKLLAYNISKKGAENMKISENSINMEFGKSDVDFDEESIIIRVHASGSIVPDIDLEEIKKGIIGKTEEDVRSFVRAYSDVNNMELIYWPSFISGKIPSYESRVDISLDPSLVLP